MRRGRCGDIDLPDVASSAGPDITYLELYCNAAGGGLCTQVGGYKAGIRKSVAERKQRRELPAIEPLVAHRGAVDIVVHQDRPLPGSLAGAVEHGARQLLERSRESQRQVSRGIDLSCQNACDRLPSPA